VDARLVAWCSIAAAAPSVRLTMATPPLRQPACLWLWFRVVAPPTQVAARGITRRAPAAAHGVFDPLVGNRLRAVQTAISRR
jgi:hypothetical protein